MYYRETEAWVESAEDDSARTPGTGGDPILSVRIERGALAEGLRYARRASFALSPAGEMAAVTDTDKSVSRVPCIWGSLALFFASPSIPVSRSSYYVGTPWHQRKTQELTSCARAGHDSRCQLRDREVIWSL